MKKTQWFIISVAMTFLFSTIIIIVLLMIGPNNKENVSQKTVENKITKKNNEDMNDYKDVNSKTKNISDKGKNITAKKEKIKNGTFINYMYQKLKKFHIQSADISHLYKHRNDMKVSYKKQTDISMYNNLIYITTAQEFIKPEYSLTETFGKSFNEDKFITTEQVNSVLYIFVNKKFPSDNKYIYQEDLKSIDEFLSKELNKLYLKK